MLKLDTFKKTPERKPSVAEQANYEGDWTLLLRERLLDPITKEKFIKTKHKEIERLNNLLTDESSKKDKDYTEIMTDEILDQINTYDTVVEKVFSSTFIGEPSSESSFTPHKDNLGNDSTIGYSYGWGHEGVIRNDKSNDIRQKNLFEAHEKVHGIVRYFNIEGLEDIFDEDEMFMELDGAYEGDYERGVRREKYLKDPNEIMVSMSQLKNYFGMKAGDVFTKEHLNYALEYYHNDLEGIGDFTSVFLDLLKKENNDKFFEIINNYPL